MKVSDIMSRTVDNYLGTIIEVFDNDTHLIKKRYHIPAHSGDYTNIPESVWNAEVGMVIVHFDSLVISVAEEAI